MIRFCVLKTPNIIMRTLRSKSVLYLRLNGQCKLHSNNQASKTKIKEDLSIHPFNHMPGKTLKGKYFVFHFFRKGEKNDLITF